MTKFMDTWEPPQMREEHHSYGWIIWVLVLIIAVGLVVFYLKQQPASTQQVTPTENTASNPTTTPSSTETAAPAANVQASNAPEMNSKCTAIAGIVPGSKSVTGNTVSATFKNNGKAAIDGSYFEFSNGDKKAYRKNSDALATGATVTYTVNLDDAANELGTAVKAFVVYPIQDGKACLNQRMVVIDNS